VDTPPSFAALRAAARAKRTWQSNRRSIGPIQLQVIFYHRGKFASHICHQKASRAPRATARFYQYLCPVLLSLPWHSRPFVASRMAHHALPAFRYLKYLPLTETKEPGDTRAISSVIQKRKIAARALGGPRERAFLSTEPSSNTPPTS
jgi:hypothetical protein